jgi:predicted enzyme related to lactoylglutathione lyase
LEKQAFHIYVTDPNIEDLSKKISKTGSKQRSKIWEVVPDKGYKIVFCEDPFGNIIEIYSNAYGQTSSCSIRLQSAISYLWFMS